MGAVGTGMCMGMSTNTGRLATSVDEVPELGSKEEGREWGGGWLRQRVAAIPEQEWCVFQSCPMAELAHDEVIFMICFGKRVQWIEMTTSCLEASQVSACHFGHASQQPRAL